MNWRRLGSSMGSPEPAEPAYRRLSMPRKHPQVLGLVATNRLSPEVLEPVILENARAVATKDGSRRVTTTRSVFRMKIGQYDERSDH
jgi:hypothetical protein